MDQGVQAIRRRATAGVVALVLGLGIPLASGHHPALSAVTSNVVTAEAGDTSADDAERAAVMLSFARMSRVPTRRAA
jgi:hypothetical protein